MRGRPTLSKAEALKGGKTKDPRNEQEQFGANVTL